ncbi:DNA/RNA polymerase [Dothidotthia symphoricarpi CBS 119687]|uniref:DNA/RNA polymerase n=1 Tax=Dothidotthia symphoricarpi CBS 119687 TaxID=1392245 RepID=A0A6A6AK57_9PLEO|nr:DNA/RNA polymerase [Dothidotthia symphoricarpi CBS 119687]KAF2130821.1 DNA/RNA polymerase [Dothidotthia symphoricarpi CBS 119687]
MDGVASRKKLRRQLEPTIIHFDYDCFYASVFEQENPHLKSVPLAVQQKQILVTCNYEARRRGLHKLQLISEAKKICPDVVIVLGEDLTRFRNASKELCGFLRAYSWNSRCERLGFDEVFMDVSDIVDYNIETLNPNDFANSFFCLSKNDPTVGFSFDATLLAGPTYPESPDDTPELESEKGYTATVGISTNKLLAKLVGNVHKPNNQTTLLPPYHFKDNDGPDNVTTFVDTHEVGKIPGIGFKIAQKIRSHVLGRSADLAAGFVYSGIKETVLVRDVRTYPGMGPETLGRILEGPGVPQGTGIKVWGLLNGCDNTEVGQAREVPKQISIEDSYGRLDTLDKVIKELRRLAKSLINRMHRDLLEDEGEDGAVLEGASASPTTTSKRWVAHPKTIRLSTRPRSPQNPDGSRNRSFGRISRAAPMPNFVFNLKDSTDALVERLVFETLVPLFRRLHPEKHGWNLSLVNVAATNIVDASSERGGIGRDIGKMFKHQDEVLRQWRVDEEEEVQEAPEVLTKVERESRDAAVPHALTIRTGSEDIPTASQEGGFADEHCWESEDDEMMDGDSYRCDDCGAMMPLFAMGAHGRWHAQT